MLATDTWDHRPVACYERSIGVFGLKTPQLPVRLVAPAQELANRTGPLLNRRRCVSTLIAHPPRTPTFRGRDAAVRALKEYEAPPIDEASPELMNHDSFEQWSFAGDILAFPLRTMSSKEAMADPEISRFPYKERPCMPGF